MQYSVILVYFQRMIYLNEHMEVHCSHLHSIHMHNHLRFHSDLAYLLFMTIILLLLDILSEWILTKLAFM